jgi:hypothetical protein
MFNTNLMFNQKLMNMKKVAYLAVLMVALATVFVSCEKDNGDDLVVPEGITLVGNWNFVSIEVEGVKYDNPCGTAVDDEYDVLAMSLLSVTTTDFNMVDDCGTWDKVYEYTISGDVVTFNNNWTFKIMNASTFNGDRLVLKLTYTNNNKLPVGATYTLDKI